MMNEEMEEFLVTIISNVGAARSCYIEAIHDAKAGNFHKAKELIKEGESLFYLGHEAHLKLLSQEGTKNGCPIYLITLHAEDQLMSAEGFHIIAQEFMDVYESIHAKQ